MRCNSGDVDIRTNASSSSASFGLATGVCVALELFRERHYGTLDFRFLLWNLFLAWIPLLIALAVYDGYRRGAPLLVLAPGALLWLLFLPNAPYLVTDFVHLAPQGPPLWFDGVAISAFAWTGILHGLRLAVPDARHRAPPVRRRPPAGPRPSSRSASPASGVYIGRFLQWNSWDLLVRPGHRLAEIAPRLGEPAVVAHAFARDPAADDAARDDLPRVLCARRPHRAIPTARRDEPGLVRVDHDLDPVAEAELLEDVRDVRLRRGLA